MRRRKVGGGVAEGPGAMPCASSRGSRCPADSPAPPWAGGNSGSASLGECLGSGKGPKCLVCGAGSAAPLLPPGGSAAFYLSCGLMRDVAPSSWT